MRAAPAMFSLTTWWMPQAASVRRRGRVARRTASTTARAASTSSVIAPPRKKAGSRIAEQQVGVGHGRLAPAAAVAGRAGLRAGAVRPDLQQAERVDPGDAAAAGADLDHLDHRHSHRQAAALLEAVDAADLELGAERRAAVVDQAALAVVPPMSKESRTGDRSADR